MTSDRGKLILLWFGLFAGVGILYSAYKGNLNPIKTVTDALSGTPTTTPASDATTSSTTTGGSGASNLVGTTGDAIGTVGDALGSGVNQDVTQSNGTWYVADQYGNPTTPVPGAYQGLPNNYIPNTGGVFA